MSVTNFADVSKFQTAGAKRLKVRTMIAHRIYFQGWAN